MTSRRLCLECWVLSKVKLQSLHVFSPCQAMTGLMMGDKYFE